MQKAKNALHDKPGVKKRSERRRALRPIVFRYENGREDVSAAPSKSRKSGK